MKGSSRYDLTSGPIAATLFAFSLPMLLANVLQSLSGSINAMWVGQLLGKASLAATTNANLVQFMITALSSGCSMATTIFIGQHMGQRNLGEARRFAGAGAGFFLAFSIAAAIVGWFGAPAALRFLATPANVYPHALAYSRVLFLGLPATMLISFLQQTLRGTGDSLTPMLFLLPSAAISIGLNPVLILGLGFAPRMGIAGSALASLIANYISLVLLVGYIYARDIPIRLRGPELRHLVPSGDLILTIVRKGTPMGLQMIIASVASLGLIGLVNRQGTSTVAAYGATNQIWTYVQMPAMAIGAAVSTMAAQNIGGGHWNRIGKIAVAGLIANLSLTGAIVLAINLFDKFLLGMFLGGDELSTAIGQRINLIATWSYVLAGVMIVFAAVPRANGVTLPALIIMSIALLPGRLGAAYALTPVLGPDGIWWSFPISYGVAAILTAGYYRYGGWREVHLLAPPTREELEEFVQSESEPAGRDHSLG